MNVLAIDTATEILSVALKTEGGEYEMIHRAGLSHSESLVPSIQALCSLAGFSLRDLDLVVCMKGPGSFTGLRIGMATAKGIAFGRKTPLVSVPTLDVMAFGHESFSGIVLPIIDARKNSFYTAVYEAGKRTSDYLDLAAEDILPYIGSSQKVLLTGPHGDLFLERLEASGSSHSDRFTLYPDRRNGTGFSLIACGIKHYAEAGADSKAEGPLYIRKSEAELL
jgi:tRNA threonylcarbamoyladenosine biosynthesis protein TsaB